jgi:periplasmic protein TonB
MPEAGESCPAVPKMRTAAPSRRRLGLGAAASLALHAGAAAAVAASLAWRAVLLAPPPQVALQVVWLDARPPPDVAAPIEMTEPPSPREAELPAAPMSETAAEGLEPEDLLATMLPDPVAPPVPPATADVPPLSELMATARLPEPESAPLPEPNTAMAALPVPPPPPLVRAEAPSPPPPTAARERSRQRPPRAAATAPAPRVSPPQAEAAAIAPPLPPSQQVPLMQGPPRFRRPPSPPEYPAQARDRGEEGTVGLRLLVGADGAMREVRLQRSSGNPMLDRAATDAARRWEVEPASLGGRPAEAWFEVPVRFRLDR